MGRRRSSGRNGGPSDQERQARSIKCVWRVYTVDEVVPLIGEEPYRRTVIELDGVEYTANFNSSKLNDFKRSLSCAACGRVGVEFRAESHREDPRNGSLHLNLYSEDGVLMTQDHIIPRCKGGWSGPDNTQTMCAECNVEKGSTSEVVYCCGEPGGGSQIRGIYGLLDPHEAISDPAISADLSDLESTIIP